MLRTKLIASGLVLLLSTSSLAVPAKKKVAPKPVSTIDAILNYVSSNIVPISGAVVAGFAFYYFVIRGRANQGLAMGPAVPGAMDAMRNRWQTFKAPPPGGQPDLGSAPHQGSASSPTTSAAMLRKVQPKTKVRGSAVAPKTEPTQDIDGGLVRLRTLAVELQLLLDEAAREEDEARAAELQKEIARKQAEIIQLTQIDMWQNGEFEKAVAEPFFWDLFAQEGNWLFEGLTVDQLAVALRHLNGLTNREQAMELLLKLEDALLITKGMKVGYVSRLAKLKLLIGMRDLVFMKDKIAEAVLQVALRAPQHGREVADLTRQLE